MHIDIITAFPQLFDSPFAHSMINRAKNKDLLHIKLHNLKDYGLGKHRQIDDEPYGNDAGMVLMIEPVDRCITALKSKRTYDDIIYTAPDGELWNQQKANYYSMQKNVIILCGHYKGIDERIREHLITKEISIGEYVLSGGEYAAMVMVDSISRLLPGVLGNEESALTDTFQDNMVAPPVYTRPAEYKGWKVPDILRSGNFKAINDWKMNASETRTNSFFDKPK